LLGGTRTEKDREPFLYGQKEAYVEREKKDGKKEIIPYQQHEHSQTYFQGRAKKGTKKILFFSKNSLKTYYFWPARKGEGREAPLAPPSGCP
jgi:hypothetical protein